MALLRNLSGPTIAGCSLEPQAAQSSPSLITLKLDPDRMNGEGVVIQPFDNNVSGAVGRLPRI
eukprot:COSAG01_NODE_1875_length_8997_cov_11.927624_9_plen_63_part_00